MSASIHPVRYKHSLTLNSETLATKYEGKLEKSHDGPAHQVVSTVFKGLVGKNIARPSPSFASRWVLTILPL